MQIRAKFIVDEITRTRHSSATVVKMSPVSDGDVPEDQRFHKYTPSGKLEMFIDNPSAAAEFEVGKKFYLDFTVAPVPAPA